MRFYKNLVDLETGEHLGEMIAETPQENRDRYHRQQNKMKGYGYYKDNIQPLPGFLQQEYGDFIQTKYDPLLDILNYDTATAFRFIYLCTFINYDDGYILLNDHKADKHRLNEIFCVSPNAFTKILKSLLDNNLLFCDSSGYYFVNQEYCYKGAVSNNKIYKSNYTRIFINSIRELYYKAVDSREHKLLGKFILLLPYVNIYHNVICKNIREKDMANLILPNSSDMDEILHVSTRNADRTMKDLLQITVGGRPAILNISHNQAKMYAVNPSIYYGGTNLSHLKELDGYFRAKGGKD